MSTSQPKYQSSFGKAIIFGYVRRMDNVKIMKDKLFGPNFNNVTIPAMITYLILAYFYEEEYFETAHEDCRLSKDKLTVIKTSNSKINWHNKTPFKNWINTKQKYVYHYILRINKYKYLCPNNKDNKLYQSFCIGITVINDKSKDTESDSYYEITSGGSIFGGTSKSIKFKKQSKNSLQFNQNDIVSLIINLRERRIYQIVNDNKRKCLWSNIEIGRYIKYQISVTIRHPSNSITLIAKNLY